jgi:hypothetical protein
MCLGEQAAMWKDQRQGRLALLSDHLTAQAQLAGRLTVHELTPGLATKLDYVLTSMGAISHLSKYI